MSLINVCAVASHLLTASYTSVYSDGTVRIEHVTFAQPCKQRKPPHNFFYEEKALDKIKRLRAWRKLG